MNDVAELPTLNMTYPKAKVSRLIHAESVLQKLTSAEAAVAVTMPLLYCLCYLHCK
jgi:hypothetical protein